MIRLPPRLTRTATTLSLHDALPIYPGGIEDDDALRCEFRDALHIALKRVEEGRRHRFELEPELAIACASAPSRCSSVTGLVSHARAPIARAWERVASSSTDDRTITGNPARSSRNRSIKSMPDMPGMRMSVTRQSNWRTRRAARNSAAPSKHSQASPETIRSEEHTSELQSLMRISYAVFCLKKKKTNNKT